MNQIIISEKRRKKNVKRTQQKINADKPLTSLQRDCQNKEDKEKIQ